MNTEAQFKILVFFHGIFFPQRYMVKINEYFMGNLDSVKFTFMIN